LKDENMKKNIVANFVFLNIYDYLCIFSVLFKYTRKQ